MKIIRLLLPRLLILTALLCAASSYAEVKTGAPAPDFSLKDADGKTHHLSDYKGNYVVLEWINYSCPFVKKHYQNGDMQRLQKTFLDRGVVWLSINSGASGKEGSWTPETAASETAAHEAHPTAALIDSEGNVGRLYDARTTPHMFLIDPQGFLVYQGAIDSIKSTDPSDVSQATNYLKKALKEALSGQPISKPQTQPYGCSIKYAQN